MKDGYLRNMAKDFYLWPYDSEEIIISVDIYWDIEYFKKANIKNICSLQEKRWSLITMKTYYNW